jgi:hypothetical protein
MSKNLNNRELYIIFIRGGINMSRYLANRNTREIHDLTKKQKNCKIEEMNPEHKIPLESIEQVKEYVKAGYNGCAWCLPEYNTG